MIKAGRKTLAWAAARKKLKVIYEKKGITSCELRFKNCTGQMFMGFAHRYKRSDPRTEHTFEQTVLACNPCHDQIEYDKDLTETIFEKLRPERG